MTGGFYLLFESLHRLRGPPQAPFVCFADIFPANGEIYPLHKGGFVPSRKGERYMKATGIVRRVDDLGTRDSQRNQKNSQDSRRGPLADNIDTFRQIMLGDT